jgi:ABC-type glucose/galactose transport system permease subunit
MKQRTTASVPMNKVIAIWLLSATTVLITLMGLSFMVYSILYNVSFAVLQSTVPGAVFGAVIAFLGVRYFLAVRKLRIRLYGTNSQFSWKNFRFRKSCDL